MLAILAVIWIENAFPTNRFFLPVIMAVLGTLHLLFHLPDFIATSWLSNDLQAAAALLPTAAFAWATDSARLLAACIIWIGFSGRDLSNFSEVAKL